MSTKQKSKKTVPFFGSGILVDSARKGESGKIDSMGGFTVIHAWDFPSSTKTFHALMTIYNLPKGPTAVAVSIGKRRSRKIKSIALIDVESKSEKDDLILHIPIRHKFESSGYHEVIFSFRDYSGKHRIPFKVKLKNWPILSEEELNVAKKLGEAAPSFRVNVHCSECGHAYIFEERLSEDVPIKGGVNPFPEDGIFICEECSYEIRLNDIRGQLLESLRTTLRQQIKE